MGFIDIKYKDEVLKTKRTVTRDDLLNYDVDQFGEKLSEYLRDAQRELDEHLEECLQFLINSGMSLSDLAKNYRLELHTSTDYDSDYYSYTYYIWYTLVEREPLINVVKV